ncbi:MAG: M50 family metallopeptidase [Alphaproteobacteria bacterium]|nr:M50 family metallopeptidase [Alphaproteobacteria bacterium]
MNFLLRILKWPIAVAMVLLFMPALDADIMMIRKTLDYDFMLTFVVPMLGMIFVWFIIPGLNGSHFSIFEHEFTHMVAALLTFHAPKSMNIESDRGGAFSFYGEGNWFITLAPYFIPTFPLLIMLASLFWTLQGIALPFFFMPVLGVMFGYHLVSNAVQIHGDQTDFPTAGWLFSVLFLPTANLLTFGVVWAFAAHGWSGVSSWNNLLFHSVGVWLDKVL